MGDITPLPGFLVKTKGSFLSYSKISVFIQGSLGNLCHFFLRWETVFLGCSLYLPSGAFRSLPVSPLLPSVTTKQNFIKEAEYREMTPYPEKASVCHLG